MFKNTIAKYVPNKLANKDKFHLKLEICQTPKTTTAQFGQLK